MTTTPLHVVLGAGPAGSTLATHLARTGARVRIVSRSSADLGPGIESVAADLSHPASAVAATEGAAVIYHCVNVAYHRQVELLPGIADAILAAAAAHGARLVVLDTLYPYGEADGHHLTEQTPWAATSRKGLLRAELDRRYLTAHADGSVRVSLGRSADFFGPGVVSSTLGGACFPALVDGGPVLALGDLDLPHSYSYLPDVVAGLATLGGDDRGDGAVWHLPTVPAVTTTQVHRILGELVGRPLETVVLSEPRPFGPFDAAFMAEYAEMFYQHLIPQNMVSSAFEQTFGARPTPLRPALAATLTWYREALTAKAAS